MKHSSVLSYVQKEDKVIFFPQLPFISGMKAQSQLAGQSYQPQCDGSSEIKQMAQYLSKIQRCEMNMSQVSFPPIQVLELALMNPQAVVLLTVV